MGVDVVELLPRLVMLRFPVGQAYVWRDGANAVTLVDAGPAGSGARIVEAVTALGARPGAVRPVTSRRQIGRSWKSPTSARRLGGSRCASAAPTTSGSKSVLFGISSISSRAVVVFPAPNAPLIQTTVTGPPLLLAPCGLPASPCHENQARSVDGEKGI
ncbi:hypothetical protein STENM223S_10997 [Streptomyces tendae]